MYAVTKEPFRAAALLSLEQLLEAHVANVRKVIAAAVLPGEDIAPMCAAFDSDGLLAVMPVLLTGDAKQRQAQHGALMQWLKTVGADAYSWVAPCWSVTIAGTGVAAQQADIIAGGGVKNRSDREETVVCVVGDKTGTVSTELLVRRGEDGTITELQQGEVSRTASGLFLDMMLQSSGRLS